MRVPVIFASILALAVVGTLAGCQDQGEAGWIYTLREGDDSFMAVSQKVYDDPGYADEIARANPDVGEEELEPGTKLDIPEVIDPTGTKVFPKGCDRKQIY